MSEVPQGSSEFVVVADEVTKRFQDGAHRLSAVDHISIQVPRGVLYALTGASGSGKSTLLGMLGGLVLPTSGDVILAGRSVVQMRDRHRTRWRRHHVGFVHQELALIPSMTLVENVRLPRIPTSLQPARAQKEALALLEKFGLAAKAETKIERLSGGERQRGAICRALVYRPSILLLDEPTAHIDADSTEQLLELLQELTKEGCSVLTATHDPRLFEAAVVDKVLRIEEGRLLSDGAGSSCG